MSTSERYLKMHNHDRFVIITELVQTMENLKMVEPYSIEIYPLTLKYALSLAKKKRNNK
jgi:hypothetical protein